MSWISDNALPHKKVKPLSKEASDDMGLTQYAMSKGVRVEDLTPEDLRKLGQSPDSDEE